MFRKLLIAGSAAAALAACGASDEAARTAEAAETAAGAALQTAANEARPNAAEAKAFVDAAAALNSLAARTAQLVTQNSPNEEAVAFAETIIDDHQQAGLALKDAAAGIAPDFQPSTTLSDEQETMLATLRGAEGERVASLFFEQQSEIQRQALDVLGAYQANGPGDPLAQWAEATVPIIEAHLKTLNRLS